MTTPKSSTPVFSRRRFLSTGATGLGAGALGALAAPAVRGAGFLGAAERVRMGFIGVGGRGSTHLGKTLSLSGTEVQVTWTCDIDAARAEEAAETVARRTGSKPATSLEHRRVLESKDVDAVLISTPCDVHARLYLDTIAAGKDLYAEKPMCITIAEADAIVKAAEASKCIVQVGFQNRYDPRIREGIERIRRGDFGEIIEMRGAYLASFGPLRDWRSYRARSGDWMVEQAVHFFDIMNWTFGALAEKASGWGRQDVFTEGEPDRDVTDYYSALLGYPGGAIVNWLHSWLCPRRGEFDDNWLQVMGRAGAVDLYKGDIEYMDPGRAKERLRETGGDSTLLAQKAFLECVRTREKPFADVRVGRDSVLVSLMVREAVYKGGTVTMRELKAG